MVPQGRIELPTSPLPRVRSATELLRPVQTHPVLNLCLTGNSLTAAIEPCGRDPRISFVGMRRNQRQPGRTTVAIFQIARSCLFEQSLGASWTGCLPRHRVWGSRCFNASDSTPGSGVSATCEHSRGSTRKSQVAFPTAPQAVMNGSAVSVAELIPSKFHTACESSGHVRPKVTRPSTFKTDWKRRAIEAAQFETLRVLLNGNSLQRHEPLKSGASRAGRGTVIH